MIASTTTNSISEKPRRSVLRRLPHHATIPPAPRSGRVWLPPRRTPVSVTSTTTIATTTTASPHPADPPCRSWAADAEQAGAPRTADAGWPLVGVVDFLVEAEGGTGGRGVDHDRRIVAPPLDID